MGHQSGLEKSRSRAVCCGLTRRIPNYFTGAKAMADKLIDYAKIGVIAFIGVWVINKALTAANLTQFKA
jgi:hypothetical protein